MSGDRSEINPVKFIQGIQLSVKYTREDDLNYIRRKLNEDYDIQDILDSSYFVRTQDSSFTADIEKQNQ